jgi:hypothetical protein
MGHEIPSTSLPITNSLFQWYWSAVCPHCNVLGLLTQAFLSAQAYTTAQDMLRKHLPPPDKDSLIMVGCDVPYNAFLKFQMCLAPSAPAWHGWQSLV